MGLSADITTTKTGRIAEAYAFINSAMVSVESGAVQVSLAVFDSEAHKANGAHERFALGITLPLSALSPQALDVLRAEIYSYLNDAERELSQSEIDLEIDLREWENL